MGAAMIGYRMWLTQQVLKLSYEVSFGRCLKALKSLGDHFNPAQPRDWHGRWAIEGGANSDAFSETSDPTFNVAQVQMGSFLGSAVVHSSRGGGVDCFYKFSYGIVAVPGPNSGICWSSIPWFGATHGRLIKGVR